MEVKVEDKSLHLQLRSYPKVHVLSAGSFDVECVFSQSTRILARIQVAAVIIAVAIASDLLRALPTIVRIMRMMLSTALPVAG